MRDQIERARPFFASKRLRCNSLCKVRFSPADPGGGASAECWYEAHPQAGVGRHSLRRLRLPVLELVALGAAARSSCLETALLASAQKQLEFLSVSNSSETDQGHKVPFRRAHAPASIGWLMGPPLTSTGPRHLDNAAGLMAEIEAVIR